jgi:hypothetical protein
MLVTSYIKSPTHFIAPNSSRERADNLIVQNEQSFVFDLYTHKSTQKRAEKQASRERLKLSLRLSSVKIFGESAGGTSFCKIKQVTPANPPRIIFPGTRPLENDKWAPREFLHVTDYTTLGEHHTRQNTRRKSTRTCQEVL